MKRLVLLIVAVFLTTYALAAPSNTVAVPNSFSANTTADPNEVNADFNEVQTKFNAHDHTDISQTGVITSGTWQGTAVTPTYGGTGQDLSSASQGSVVILTSTGAVGTMTPSTPGYFLQGNGSALPTWVAGGSARDLIIHGLEVYGTAGAGTARVSAGVVYLTNTAINKTTTTVLTFTTNTDWAGSVASSYNAVGNWNYIGMASNGDIKFLGNKPANVSDANGYTNGPKIYYRTGSTYYRVIGQVFDKSNTVATSQVQVGDTVYWMKALQPFALVQGTHPGEVRMERQVPVNCYEATFWTYVSGGDTPTIIKEATNYSDVLYTHVARDGYSSFLGDFGVFSRATNTNVKIIKLGNDNSRVSKFYINKYKFVR